LQKSAASLGHVSWRNVAADCHDLSLKDQSPLRDVRVKSIEKSMAHDDLLHAPAAHHPWTHSIRSALIDRSASKIGATSFPVSRKPELFICCRNPSSPGRLLVHSEPLACRRTSGFRLSCQCSRWIAPRHVSVLKWPEGSHL
jgi:hypothetical protein